MKILHVLRTQPDETVSFFKASLSGQEEKTVHLYEGVVDWEALIEDIFAAEKIISWW